MSRPAGHIRRLHSVYVAMDGTHLPVTEQSALVCADVEQAGYSVLTVEPAGRWYEYNYVIESEGRTYLAAIY